MIYWDHNAGAPLRPELADAWRRALTLAGTNPSSIHGEGRAARQRLESARQSLARALGADRREVIFTGSGSEAAALAIKGAWAARKDLSRTGIVSTTLEHPSVLGALKQLERQGAQVTRVPPGPDGVVRAEAIEAALGPQTALCSVMWVNNETGVVQPVEQIALACRRQGIVFHTDAVQAVGRIEVRPFADLLSIAGHKLGTLPGVGALIAARTLELEALVPGHQEDGRRGGTQAVAQAESLALAVELSIAERPTTAPRLAALRDDFEARVKAGLPEVVVNGDGPRVAHVSNLGFPGVDGEALLIALDLAGVRVSSGAACASGTTSPSHVLLAMGRTPAQAHGSLRFSLGPATTAAEVATVAALVLEHAPKCRE